MDISVLTIVRGRKEALENLIAGLSLSKKLPGELIIVLMNAEERILPVAPFPIRQLVLNHREPLPLAAARNLAAKCASGNLLIFLDVDCIPDPGLVGHYAGNNIPGHLLNGEVRYLENGATDEDGFMSRLYLDSSPDPIRSGFRPLPHELFWSLNFACSAKDFGTIGGFDEGFAGYGAEDTDFAFTARKSGIGMKSVPAMAYHQYHEGFSPPLNHFADIVSNAEKFFLKWNKWPMEGWLKVFADMGLINWQNDTLRMVRSPTATELLRSKKS